ncbi:hypothetical protein [Mesorhizobium mediterraneum]|uniref:hypothetical protein n=1 Tax=Mesorhizobium mediterraneum TaxID=43617 RepID=UPI001781388F|nr:hypothetical protein [Mesorhizobium mediterraneum]
MESEGNAAELQMDSITAVSAVVLSSLVEIHAGLFDDIDLGQVRTWAQFVRPGCTTQLAMATALLWLLASPDQIVPKLSADEAAAEQKRTEIARKGRENAKRRRIRAVGTAHSTHATLVTSRLASAPEKGGRNNCHPQRSFLEIAL